MTWWMVTNLKTSMCPSHRESDRGGLPHRDQVWPNAFTPDHLHYPFWERHRPWRCSHAFPQTAPQSSVPAVCVPVDPSAAARFTSLRPCTQRLALFSASRPEHSWDGWCSPKPAEMLRNTPHDARWSSVRLPRRKNHANGAWCAGLGFQVTCQSLSSDLPVSAINFFTAIPHVVQARRKAQASQGQSRPLRVYPAVLFSP